MKKKILLLALLAICAAVVVSGTLAYFTDEVQVHNVITSSAVDILIEEWQNSIGNPYPSEPIHAMPGVAVSKIVTVKSLDADAYVRAKYEVVFTGADEKIMELSKETLNGLISVKVNETDWVRKEGDSEWWYCPYAVAAGDSTKAFITEVVFDGLNMKNEYQGCTVEVIVTAQAVQKANNGGTAMEAEGWSAE